MSSLRPISTNLTRPICRFSSKSTSVKSWQTTSHRAHPTQSTQKRFAGTLVKTKRHFKEGTLGRTQLHFKDYFSQPRFVPGDVPPLAFWQSANPDLDPNESMEIARAYARAAVNGEIKPGLANESINRRFPVEKLHKVATGLMKAGSGSPILLMLHMLHHLQSRGFLPSLLTMINFSFMTKMTLPMEFKEPLDRFEANLQKVEKEIEDEPRARDLYYNYGADLCTLRALMCAREGTAQADREALRWYQRAYKIGTLYHPDPQVAAELTSGHGVTSKTDKFWQLKPRFVLGLADLRLKRGELDKAEELYRVAARDLDLADGYDSLAKILAKKGKRDTEEYRQCLLKAAVSGKPDAARELAELESERAKEEGLSAWEKKKRSVFAAEWLDIANGDRPAAKRGIA
ncbi:hypothetical protein F5Y16DRAFT_14360 [Xylariaceae sp. FL0255]|nr:hypothetical protein F5Y16DRAFT_14360 [Xylariaceae sp. FL0255]